MKNYFFIICFILLSTSLFAQDLSYFLPQDEIYDKKIPTPKQIIGHEVGEMHVTHDKLVFYMNALSKNKRVKLDTIGFTHEKRPLLVLTITSEKNHARLDKIIAQRQEIVKNPNANIPPDMPVVAYLGYSVHGNEPSGSNAALLVAYHLVASQSEKTKELLENAVILFDPCFNPDGLNRFATWVNMFGGNFASTDPTNIEFNENFPFGRTNHYWFDLNRDWLPLVHPESQARLKVYHQWKPNVLTDHHEMGTNSTFFFQPGVPSRTNPLTPKENQQLTKKIGTFHEKELDKIGSLYYSEENFDDFYYGKGSTFPEASSRGHAQESIHGVLTFPFTIRNQVKASFSTLEALFSMKKELLAWQKQFYNDAAKKASLDAQKAFVFGSDKDAEKNLDFIKILLQHKIEVYTLKDDLKTSKGEFKANESFIIPYEQAEYTLIKGFLQKENKFADSLFYDISAWTFSEAFRLKSDFLTATNFKKALLGEKISLENLEQKRADLGICEKASYAYAFAWEQSGAGALAHALLADELLLKVSQKPFLNEKINFTAGTVIIPIAMQKMNETALFELLNKYAKKYAVKIYALKTGANEESVDLGSDNFSMLAQPKVLTIVGQNVNPNEIGEIWHFLNKKLAMPITIVDEKKMGRLDLSRYNTLILASNSYQDLANRKAQIQDWVMKDGGNIIALGNGIKWLQAQQIGDFQTKKIKTDSLKQRPYNLYEQDLGASQIGGVILDARADLTHPLAFGLENAEIRLFRDNDIFLMPSKNPYATPFRYAKNALWAGFLTKKNETNFSEGAAVVVKSLGKGKLIAIPDNLLFRGFWLGTSKILTNSIFFAPIIDAGTGR